MDFLLLRSVGLIFTLFVIQFYAYTGAYSKRHRLLPVLLTCVVVYNFYEVVLALSGQTELFFLLEQLLFVQTFYVVFHYIFDFMGYKIPFYFEIIIFTSLIIENVITVLQHLSANPLFEKLFLLSVYGYTFIMAGIVIFGLYQRALPSKRESYVIGMIYLAMLLPTICVPLRRYFTIGIPLMILALMAGCGIVFYLLMNNYLLDVNIALQEALYANNGTAVILLDSKCNYINANREAQIRFDKHFIRHIDLEELKKESIFSYHGCYYKTMIETIDIRNGYHGYAVSFLDYTEEMKQSEKLKENNKQLQLASHKMRTPLNAIIGLSDYLITRKHVFGETKRLIQQIREAGRDLLVNVDDILLMSQEGKLSLENEKHELQSEELSEDCQPDYIYPRARFLLAEDMQLNQVVFARLMEIWQVQLDIASDGEEALAYAKRNEYQMIFLDKMMPGMDGLETALALQSITNAFLVLVTADLSDYSNINYADYGIGAFLSKPIDFYKLREIIQTHMEEQYREFPFGTVGVKSAVTTEKIRNIFKQELTEICSELKSYDAYDLSMFRIKVHGIKSVAKQMGYEDMAYHAEVMEMAAKTENRVFIEKYLPEFLELCSEILEGM